MKLSEVLRDWPELLKKQEKNVISDIFINSTIDKINENITSCDREIDREALAGILRECMGMELGDASQHIISTMPTWLKRIDGE